MANGRTRRMHTVSESHLEGFAVSNLTRRTARVWRFDRISGTAKIIGVKDSEVVNDFYTVYGDDGTPNIGIEEILCSIESAWGNARQRLQEQTFQAERLPLSAKQWIGLLKFVAAQLWRTPRFFQLMRDGFIAEGIVYEENALQLVMVDLIQRWIDRLARMNGIVAHTETDLPLLTSDNPAVMWKKYSDSFVCGGVDQYDPELVISCPLSSKLVFIAYQTPGSLKAVYAERYDVPHAKWKLGTGLSHAAFGTLPESEVWRLNHICVCNAQRYVYANNCDKPVLEFLENWFFGKPAPVRARDLQPIGSPIKTAPTEGSREVL